MELVPALHCCACSEEAAYLAVGKVESLFQKLKVKGRLVSPEASSPYPLVSCCGLFWADDDTAGAIIWEGEVQALISVPFRGLPLRPGSRSKKGERKKEDGSR
jgi:hypothetical protein